MGSRWQLQAAEEPEEHAYTRQADKAASSGAYDMFVWLRAMLLS